MGKAISQPEHWKINAREWPGTRQLCVKCSDATGRCEEDAIYLEDGTGPICEFCYETSRECGLEKE